MQDNEALTWFSGDTGQYRWVEARMGSRAKLTLSKTYSAKNVRLLLYDLRPQTHADAEVPCFCEFAVEVRGEEPDEVIAVDGYGQLVQMTDGSVGFVKSLAEICDDSEVFAPVWAALKDCFMIVVNGDEYPFQTDRAQDIRELYASAS